MSRHVAASNALEECKVGVKPPSTMVLSQAEPNPFKLSIETDLRSHCVRPYMSSFSPSGAIGSMFESADKHNNNISLLLSFFPFLFYSHTTRTSHETIPTHSMTENDSSNTNHFKDT